MQFEMHWGETPVADGDSQETFGVEEFHVGQRIMSGIREYQVTNYFTDTNGTVIVEVEPV